jgi:hypothetical protein
MKCKHAQLELATELYKDIGSLTKHKIRVNISTFIPYLKQDTARPHYKTNVGRCFLREIITRYFENHMKPINTVGEEGTELLNVEIKLLLCLKIIQRH